MPRYCAVKVCRNRGGAAARTDNRRISFYPFPLLDKPRLQKWVDNMRREEWTPSRHQYLCSEHFTEDCFDIRWGIRYLKNTAIPTVFPSVGEDGENFPTNDRSPKPWTFEAGSEAAGSNPPHSKRPLILSRTRKKFQPFAERTDMTHPIHVFELPVVSNTRVICKSDISDAGEGAKPAGCLALTSQDELLSGEQTDASVTVLYCESLNASSAVEANTDAAVLQPELDLSLRFAPVGTDVGDSVNCFVRERGLDEEEHISVYEHSYCRPDTDEDQLWSKILSLHAKILELDRREESTVARIRALETEIALLKKDGAVSKEKQKVLEHCISHVFL